MTQFTPDLNLPYPEGVESPDGPTQLQALAEAVEQVILDRTPTGTVRPTIKPIPDTGWLMCDGGAKDKATYPELDMLLAGLGYPFGSNPTTFNVPDLRGRVPVGVDGTAGRLSANDTLGAAGGAEEVTLTAAESGLRHHTHGAGGLSVASHTHPLDADPLGTATGGGNASKFRTATGPEAPVVNGSTAGPSDLGASGPGDATNAHENMPPFICLHFQVKT